MEQKDRLNALEVALNNEMKERAFYLKHTQRTKKPIGKAMFQQIANEELEHYERLKQLHQRWEKNEKWPETIPLKVADTLVKNVLKDLIKKVDQIIEENADDLEAVRTAIDFEAKEAIWHQRDSIIPRQRCGVPFLDTMKQNQQNAPPYL